MICKIDEKLIEVHFFYDPIITTHHKKRMVARRLLELLIILVQFFVEIYSSRKDPWSHDLQ